MTPDGAAVQSVPGRLLPVLPKGLRLMGVRVNQPGSGPVGSTAARRERDAPNFDSAGLQHLPDFLRGKNKES